VAAAAVAVTVGPGVATPAAGAGVAVLRAGHPAAVEHVREGREAPHTRPEQDGGERGGVERA